MRRSNYKPYLLLALALVATFSLPENVSASFREQSASLVSPMWRRVRLKKQKKGIKNLTLAYVNSIEGENSKLLEENLRLKEELEKQKVLMEEIGEIQTTSRALFQISSSKTSNSRKSRGLVNRCVKELNNIVACENEAVPASVSFRPADAWNSTLWINVGHINNTKLGKKVIQKNSPVISKNCVVGVVEHVGKYHSKVRLITDSSLVISVRTSEGFAAQREMERHLEKVETLSQSPAYAKSNLFKSAKNYRLSLEEQRYPYVKGEVFGSSTPFWRKRKQTLTGIGFNTEELSTGAEKEGVKVGDQLVTTGWDGIFLPGLKVGIVSQVTSLREGGSSHEIEVIPSVDDLDELGLVLVLPANDFSD